MNITCEMAEDLLPLYLEGTCSADSRAALEAHLHICPTCREKRERMERNIPTLPKQAAGVVPLSDCARRIRRHRLRTAGLVLLLSVLFSAFDTLNEDYTLIGARTIEKSKSYKPVMRLSERIFPFLEWVGEQVPRQAREQDEE